MGMKHGVWSTQLSRASQQSSVPQLSLLHKGVQGTHGRWPALTIAPLFPGDYTPKPRRLAPSFPKSKGKRLRPGVPCEVSREDTVCLPQSFPLPPKKGVLSKHLLSE